MNSANDLVLLPRPRTVRPGEGAFPLRAGIRIVLAADPPNLFPIAERLQTGIRQATGLACGITGFAGSAGTGPSIVLGTDPRQPPQGYTLSIAPERIELRAADAAGLFYGVMTLTQALRQSEGSIPTVTIEDSPDFPTRGVMLDISRDKVPTMETLFSLVDLFSELKLNHLELYTEHTFAYSGHPEVWAGASPMTGEEIPRLDAWCRERFIELVPNQNSFGHMHRWLTLRRYRHLAECPDGFDLPWGATSNEPFSLDPSNPGSLALLHELYAELLPNFKSGLFNVGCDETFDLGQGKNRDLCARKGKGRVYLDFLLKIYDLVKSHGKRMLFWGDIIMEHPELVAELPRDIIALEWGYEARHPFAEHAARFAASGVPFWVCPGTSSWNSIAGRTENCLGNLSSAADAGLANGASGFLITDWGDNGHWQCLPVSYLGFASGASLSWCCASNRSGDFTRQLDLHVFKDRSQAMGNLAHDLGNAYLHAGLLAHNESLLFHILLHPELATLPAPVTAAMLEETKRFVESAGSLLSSARMDRPDSVLVHDEYANTVRLLLHACDRGIAIGKGILSDPKTRLGLDSDLRTILGEYRRLWVGRNRIGGLHDSARRLERLLAL